MKKLILTLSITFLTGSFAYGNDHTLRAIEENTSRTNMLNEAILSTTTQQSDKLSILIEMTKQMAVANKNQEVLIHLLKENNSLLEALYHKQ